MIPSMLQQITAACMPRPAERPSPRKLRQENILMLMLGRNVCAADHLGAVAVKLADDSALDAGAGLRGVGGRDDVLAFFQSDCRNHPARELQDVGHLPARHHGHLNRFMAYVAQKEFNPRFASIQITLNSYNLVTFDGIYVRRSGVFRRYRKMVSAFRVFADGSHGRTHFPHEFTNSHSSTQPSIPHDFTNSPEKNYAAHCAQLIRGRSIS